MWIYTILTANLIIVIGSLILAPSEALERPPSIPSTLLSAYVIADLGAFIASVIPLFVFIFLHYKYNQKGNKIKAIVMHTIASTLGYITAIQLLSDLGSLDGDNYIVVSGLTAVHHLTSIIYLLIDNKKHKLNSQITE